MLRRSLFCYCGSITLTTPPPAKVTGPASINVGGFSRPAVVTFVRHSESYNNVKHDALKHGDAHNACFELVREADPMLTERGVLQAQLVAQRLACEETFADSSLIITSHMNRALKTAEAVQRAFLDRVDRKVPVMVDRDFHEIGGHYHAVAVETSPDEEAPKSPKYRCIGTPGRTTAEIHAEYPTFKFRPEQDCSRGWWAGAGKESVTEGQLRAAKVWNQLQEGALSGEQTIVVTHGYLYRVMMHVANVAGLFANPPNRDFQLIQNTGITRIQFQDAAVFETAFDSNEWVSDTFVPLLRLRKESLRVLVENDGQHVQEIGSLACRNIPVVENPSS